MTPALELKSSANDMPLRALVESKPHNVKTKSRLRITNEHLKECTQLNLSVFKTQEEWSEVE